MNQVRRDETSLRERKKQQTRDHLIDAAFSLFEERGFDHVSAAEIAEQANVSERTFYRYFPTKEDVIFPDGDEKMAHVDEMVANLPKTMSVVEGLRAGIRAITVQTQESTELQLARARLVMSTPSLQSLIMRREQEWVESFADAIAARLDLDQEADIRPELTAAVIVAVFRVVMNRWIRSGGREPIEDMIDDALAYIGTGLVT